MNIYLGADHAGYDLKEKIKIYLSDLGYRVNDLGAFNFVADDDYPDHIKQVAEAVAKEEGSFGVIIGGSGQGEAMCANRTTGVRAAVFYGPKEPISAIEIEGTKSSDSFKMVELERMHNNANILSIGARFVTEDEAKFACEVFLNTKFREVERHIRRIKKF